MKKLFNTHLLIPIIFFTSIYSSMAGYFVKLDPLSDVNENRAYSRLPALSFTYDDIISYPNKFEQNFNDNFGFRKTYIYLNSYIKYTLWKTSGISKVVVGKDKWLFYQPAEAPYRDASVFKQDTIRQWILATQIKQKYCAKHDIAYYLTVVPNKISVYPEYLRDHYLTHRATAPVDRLEQAFIDHSPDRLVNLKTWLLDHKDPSKPSFYKTDSHINYWGAFFIAQAILERISAQFPQCVPPQVSDFEVTHYESYGGDLARMLALQKIITDDWIFLTKKPHWSFVNESDSIIIDPAHIYIHDDHSHPIETSIPNTRQPRAIMFRDSCSKALIPFLSEQFSYIQYIWEDIGYETPIKNTIEHSSPDIFIEEIVERNLVAGTAIPKDIAEDLYRGSSQTITKLDANQCTHLFQKSGYFKKDFFIPLNTAVSGCLVLHLKINAARSANMTISYLTENEHKYTPYNTSAVAIENGHNEAFVVLLSDSITGDLKISFSQPLDFDIESIEIKQAP